MIILIILGLFFIFCTVLFIYMIHTAVLFPWDAELPLDLVKLKQELEKNKS